jgi:BolA protein
MSGVIEARIREKIESRLSPVYFEIHNESHMHGGPRVAGVLPETHFRAVIVSSSFEGKARIARQREVLDLIQVEMKNGVHAFTMRCLTPSEAPLGEDGRLASEFSSPPCHGGSKR